MNPADISKAVAEFVKTVDDIETARELDEWLPAKKDEISEQDCAICDLRWNCPTPKLKTIRHP